MRLCIGPDGSLATGQRGGRGAWLCRGSLTCLEAARRRRAIGRALRRAVDDDAVAHLYAVVRAENDGKGTPLALCEDGAPGRCVAPRQAEQGI